MRNVSLMMALALLVALGLLTFGPSSAQAALTASSGTTNPADLPTIAILKMKQDYPAWTVDSAILRANMLSVAIAAHNPVGSRKAFSAIVVTKIERGKTVYYIGEIKAG